MPTAQTRPGTSPKQSELLDRTRESIIALHAQHPDDVPDPQTAIRLVGETLRATPLRTQKTAGAIKIVGWAMTYLRACRPGGHELIEGAGPLAPHLLWREAGTGVVHVHVLTAAGWADAPLNVRLYGDIDAIHDAASEQFDHYDGLALIALSSPADSLLLRPGVEPAPLTRRDRRPSPAAA